MSFGGKVILITGASSGIGAACAEYFAKEGALLALVGRSAEKFEKVVEKIKANGIEEEPLVILADISVDAERIITETIEKYEKLDILINNAGIANYGDIETAKVEEFDSIMATNVRGVFELTQKAVPHLIESNGNIVNISSALSITPIPSMILYSMSKAALDQFTRCLAIGLASKGVRVNSVNPGTENCLGFRKKYSINKQEFKKKIILQDLSIPIFICILASTQKNMHRHWK